jgi:hypothetical protein
LRVMRHRPYFWWVVVGALGSFGNVWRESGPVEMLLTMAGALVLA